MFYDINFVSISQFISYTYQVMLTINVHPIVYIDPIFVLFYVLNNYYDGMVVDGMVVVR